MEIAKWNESKWLVLSSFLFTIPAAFAFHHHLYSYSSLLLMTTVVSINYWRDARFSERRNLDIFVARTGFVVFFITGILRVTYTPYVIIGYTGTGCLALSYFISGKMWNEKNPNWYRYHMLFHLLLMCEQLIILDSIR